MKYLLYISVILMAFVACEEDDICVDGKSPQLYMKFENRLPQDSLRMDSLIIFRKEPNGNFEMISAKAFPKSIDSTKVSLRIDEVNQTQLILTPRRFQTNLYDTLSINYDRKIVYGSKACGYKVNYLQTAYHLSQHFFVGKEELDTNIINEETPHILFYY